MLYINHTDQKEIYRVVSNAPPTWTGWYAPAAGLMGCYETKHAANRAAIAHKLEEYEIWKIYAGIEPPTSEEYFSPIMVVHNGVSVESETPIEAP